MSKRETEPQLTATKLRRALDPIGTLMSEVFHFLGLFAIGAATVWAAAHAFYGMVIKGHATVEDLLLLFIYLEIGSMVGIYFKTNSMPLRFVIYIGITALTRHLIGVGTHDGAPGMGIVILAGGILMLSVAAFIIRYTSFHYGTTAGFDASVLKTDSDQDAKRKR